MRGLRWAWRSTAALPRRALLLLLALLLGPGAHGAQDVALATPPAAAGSQPSGACPPGYFANASLLFACGASGGGGSYELLLGGETPVVGEAIPPSVVNLTLFVQAAGSVGIAVLDMETGADLAETPEAAAANMSGLGAALGNGSGNATGGTGGNASDVAAAARAAGVAVRLVAAAGGGDTVSLQGEVRRQLLLVLTGGSAMARVQVRYSYKALTTCPGVPLGCSRYDGFAARDAVVAWSSWASSAYADPERAWQGLCAPPLLAAGLEVSAPAPPQVWQAVWASWPAAAPASSGQWRLALRFVEALDQQDSVVTFAEFSRAYKLAGVSLSVFTFCTRLHERYPNATEAWDVALGGAEVTFPLWSTSVWSNFIPPDHFHKATPTDSFQYVDASGTGSVTRAEFDNVWDSCHNEYKPEVVVRPSTVAPTTTVTASTWTVSSTATTTTSAAAAPATTTAPTTVVAVATAPGNASGVPGNASAVAPAAANASASLARLENASRSVGGLLVPNATGLVVGNATGDALGNATGGTVASTTGNATANATGNVTGNDTGNVTAAVAGEPPFSDDLAPGPAAAAPLCCEEFRADCLACQTGRGAAELCGERAFEGLAGCPAGGAGAAATAAAAAAAGEAVGCMLPGFAAGPPLAGTGPTTEASIAACQARCRRTLGCGFFTLWEPQGDCWLQGVGAALAPAAAATSGPPACAADLELRFEGVDFDQLSEEQLTDLRGRLAAQLALALGLERAQDLASTSGDLGQVSLLAVGGKLAARGRATLAAGDGPGAAEAAAAEAGPTLVAALTVANVSVAGDAGPSLTATAAPACYLRAAKYAELPVSDADNPMVEVPFSDSQAATSPQDCQAKCAVQPSCSHFTFWQGSRHCTLLGADVRLEPDAGATAGPSACPSASAGTPRPRAVEVQLEEAAHALGDAESFLEQQPDLLLAGGVLAVVVLTLGLAVLCRRLKGRGGGHRYEALSRGESDGDDAALQDEEGGYVPEPPDSRSPY